MVLYRLGQLIFISRQSILKFFVVFFLFNSCSKENAEGETEVPISEERVGWVKTFGGSKNDVAQAVVPTADGGFAILGHTQSNDGDLLGKTDESFDVWLLKFDVESNLSWNKTYGSNGNDRGMSILEKQDGGYAILGFKESTVSDDQSNTLSRNVWLASLDQLGNVIWEKSYGYSGLDYGTHLIQTQDGGYLLVGVLDVTASAGLGNRITQRHAGGDYWAIKLDASGNIQWRNYYGGGFTDTPYDVTATNDGGYIIVGSSDSNETDITNNRGGYDFWVVKISSEGTLLWEKSFGGNQIDEAHAILTDREGNFIIVGDTRSGDQNVSLNKGGADLWIIKISPDGELLQEKTFGGSSFDVGRSLFLMSNNGLLISGSSRSLDGDLTKNQGQNDAWILHTDIHGNTLHSQHTYGGSNIDFANDAIQLQNGFVIGVGETSSNDGDLNENRGFSDLLVIKMDME